MLVKDQEFLQKGLAPSKYVSPLSDMWPSSQADIPVLAHSAFTLLLGPGVLSTRGTQHRRQRKLLNPVFSASHLRDMTHIFYGIAHKVQKYNSENSAR